MKVVSIEALDAMETLRFEVSLASEYGQRTDILQNGAPARQDPQWRKRPRISETITPGRAADLPLAFPRFWSLG